MSAVDADSHCPLLAAVDIRKRFGQVEALRGVDFSVSAGEIVALLGDNGAGKSTLIKILNGLDTPDGGRLLWEGSEVAFRSTRDAAAIGIATVYQDLALVDSLSVYRNMFLGREAAVAKGVWGIRLLDYRRAKKEAARALEDLGVRLQNPNVAVGRLSGGQRQSIAIARAVYFSAKVLILDEPTSALSIRQTRRVLDVVEAAKRRDIAVVLISHNVHQAEEVADRFVVLSQGRSIANLARGEATVQDISELIDGTGKVHRRTGVVSPPSPAPGHGSGR